MMPTAAQVVRAGQSRCLEELGHRLSDGGLSFRASNPALVPWKGRQWP